MQFGVMVTNNGKHSDAKMGFAVANDIVQVGADASGQDAFDARKLQDQIADIAEGYFAKVSDYEHAELAADAAGQMSKSLDPHPELMDGLVADIIATIAASPFASWWSSQDTAGLVRKVADKWMRNAHHMHRDWHSKGKIGNHTNLTDVVAA